MEKIMMGIGKELNYITKWSTTLYLLRKLYIPDTYFYSCLIMLLVILSILKTHFRSKT